VVHHYWRANIAEIPSRTTVCLSPALLVTSCRLVSGTGVWFCMFIWPLTQNSYNSESVQGMCHLPKLRLFPRYGPAAFPWFPHLCLPHTEDLSIWAQKKKRLEDCLLLLTLSSSRLFFAFVPFLPSPQEIKVLYSSCKHYLLWLPWLPTLNMLCQQWAILSQVILVQH
jgi:hypothetical protein